MRNVSRVRWSVHSKTLQPGLFAGSTLPDVKEVPGSATHLLLFIAFSLIFAVSSILHAQVAGTGTIEGTVSDPSGAVVPGATVTATNSATGLRLSQKTSQGGSYAIVALPPGEYKVNVEAAGFDSTIHNQVIVNALSQVGLNIALRVGSSDQQVVVSGASPELQTENGTVETTIPSTTYNALPVALNGGPKSPIAFVGLVPGVTTGQFFGAPVINGGSQNSSLIYINGLPLASSELQGGVENLGSTSTEDIDQFQVISSGVPANYDGQGIVNLVLKSGTNKIHGAVYENIRNTAFDAKGYFTRGPTPVEHQNEFGFTVGGPVLRNRLFYFGSYDNFKITTGSSPQFQSIPTAAARMGDFSAFPDPIYDPATTVCTGGACRRTQFPGNIIPASRISSVALNLQSYLPAPQNSAIQNNYFNTFTDGSTNHMYLAKIDATIRNNNNATFLFQESTSGPLNVTAYLPLPYTSNRAAGNTTYFGQLSDTQILTPNLLNIFGAELIRTEGTVTNLTIKGDYPSKAGLTGLPEGQPSTAFPSINFGGPNSPTAWANGTTAFAEIPTSEVFQDNIHWSRGRHSLTFGGQLVLQQEVLDQPSQLNGLNFANTETAAFTTKGDVNTNTGNAYASYLLGLVDSGSALDTAVQATGGRWRNYGLYAQDDWKMTPRFTLNIGLRYTIPKPYVEQHDRTSWLNPTLPNAVAANAPGALQFAGSGPDSCHCRTNVKTHYLTFGPRFGFAYKLDNHSVIRSSFSIVHYNGGALGGNGQQQGVGTQGYSTSPSFQSPDGGITPAFNLNEGFPAYQRPPFFTPTLGAGYTTSVPVGGGISYDRPETAGRSPYTEEWNLTFEREFPASTVFSLTYSGTSSHFNGVQGGVGIYSNQVDPKYLSLGNLLQQQETPATLAQAQAIFPDIKLPFPNFAGSIGQMLRPFPQYNNSGSTFTGPDPWANFGTSSYNALQVSLTRRLNKGLYFLAAYTWSKTLDEGGNTVQFVAQAPRSAYNLAQERSVSNIDIPHAISISEVYELPFGKGHRFGGQNPILRATLGNWQISGIEQYHSGTPIGTIFGNCNDPYQGGAPLVSAAAPCYADYNPAFTGSAKVNGGIGSGVPGTTSYFNVNAFQNAAPFTVGNTPRIISSLRNQWGKDESVSVTKTIPLSDRFTFQFKADAFNVFNRTQFGGITTNIASSAFGQVSNQSNTPRQLQFEGYMRF
jgi:hypothetical protein